MSSDQTTDRGLSIASPEGRARYFGRPLYFGPFSPDAPGAIDALFEYAAELEVAEATGQLAAALARLGLSSKEQWWHIEASFYQRHLAGLDDPEARQRQLVREARRRWWRRQAQALAGELAR